MNNDDTNHDKCGLFGVISLETDFRYITSEKLSFIPHQELKDEIAESLLKLQHRGQESYGVSYIDMKTNRMKTKKKLGLISKQKITSIKSHFEYAICHVRYSTSKHSKNQTEQFKLLETQPLSGKTHKHGVFTLAHNGNIPQLIQDKLIEHYKIKQTTHSDSETIVRLIEKFTSQYDNFKDGLIKFVNLVEGVYNLLILRNNGTIYAIRDRHGFKPLTIGKTSDTEYYVSSETCAFNDDVKVVRDIEAGEIVKIHSPYSGKIQLSTIHKEHNIYKPTFCSFEYIYFMRPESTFANINVANLRFRLGTHLATNEKQPIESSIVIGMPNTAIPVGEGFASLLQLPYKQYIRKAVDCGRTFILPDNADRLYKLRNKFVFSDELKHQKIYLCDDSVVRGNTMMNLISILKKDYKVKEVHVRIASPPVISVCYYGVDIPTKGELIANRVKSIDKIKTMIGADSLLYLDLDKMKEFMETKEQNVCTSCFDDKYDERLFDW